MVRLKAIKNSREFFCYLFPPLTPPPLTWKDVGVQLLRSDDIVDAKAQKLDAKGRCGEIGKVKLER